jgi:peptidoglycan hydrolase-like protein with peptidoglycan-binding domain
MTSPPTSTKVSFQLGDTHQGVWAIQRGLNSLDWLDSQGLSDLIEDGDFGPGTDTAVKAYQNAVALTADGVFGPKSQARFVRSCIVRTDAGTKLPKGLLEGVIQGESGAFIAAVNTSTPGGTDCGYTQRRVTTPYSEAAVQRAFDSLYQIDLACDTFYDRFNVYITKTAVAKRSDKSEYAWRLATLYHNWPYGANRLADGYVLSNQVAGWVPDSAPDWAKTYSGWAKYYAMGSKYYNWPGMMTQQAFGVPIDG